MGTIIIYKKLSDRVIKSEAKKALPQIKKWFENNPKRKDCNAEFFYGKMVTIRRTNIDEDFKKAVNEALGRSKGNDLVATNATKTKSVKTTCTRCDGTREEPGAPVEQDGAIALCSKCKGKGTIKKKVKKTTKTA